VQLHLDDIIQVPRKDIQATIDLKNPGNIKSTLDASCDKLTITDQGYKLEPRNFILAQTHEEVGFPNPPGMHPFTPILAGRIVHLLALAC